MDLSFYILMVVAGTVAAAINALAGGGPVLTLGLLSLTGIDPRIANLTSTVALSSGQLLAGNAARASFGTLELTRPRLLIIVSLVGGATGAVLLLQTTGTVFRAIVPWLVLVATAIYAWTSFRPTSVSANRRVAPEAFAAALAPLAIYGGYFGGGNSFLVLALLGVSGHAPREAAAIKNALIAAIKKAARLTDIAGPVMVLKSAPDRRCQRGGLAVQPRRFFGKKGPEQGDRVVTTCAKRRQVEPEDTKPIE